MELKASEHPRVLGRLLLTGDLSETGSSRWTASEQCHVHRPHFFVRRTLVVGYADEVRSRVSRFWPTFCRDVDVVGHVLASLVPLSAAVGALIG